MELSIVLIRLVLTFALSYLFGLDRQRSHKPIGFGTFIFVGIGSCGLAIAAVDIYPENPLLLLSAIVTGIGFLGAGALIKTTDKIFGFTTAASIWVFAIFGLVIGIGEYVLGLLLYSLVWVVILVDRHLETRGMGSYRKRLHISIQGTAFIKEAEKLLGNGMKHHHLLSIDIDKKNDAAVLFALVEGSKQELNAKIRKIYHRKWCTAIKVE